MNWSAGSTNVGSTGSVPPATSLARLGRGHAILAYDSAGDSDYESQVNTAPDHTFTKFAWTSNFDVTPLAACASASSYVGCNYYNMYTELPIGANYTWTPTISPLGSGTVTGTNCATGSYASGTTIGSGSGCLAVAATGYSLASTIWTGVSGSASCSGSTNPCPPFSLTANSAATANFTPNNYTVTTSVVGSGTVTGCPTGSYTYNSTVNCTATASGGYTFTGWSGTCGLIGNTTPTSFTMPLSCTVVGTFTTSGINPPLSITGTVTLSGGLSLP